MGRMTLRIGNKFGIAAGGTLAILWAGVIGAVVVAWLTHVVWIVNVLMSPSGATFGQIALGFLGAFMPPVGVVHGFIIWFS